MLIFLNLDGSAEKVTPERVFQGSNNVTEIEVVAPYPTSTALEIGFILPNGLQLAADGGATYFPMVFVGHKDGLSVWTYALPSSVTALMGDVFVSVNAVTLRGNTTSYMCKITVEESIIPLPPPQPPPDSWQQLLLLYQQLAARLQAKTLLDFTVNSVTGEGVKYYSDGSTANVQFPTGGSPPYIKTDWLRVITFSAAQSGWIQNPGDSTWEIAFGAQQTGFTDNNYVSVLDSADERVYEAGVEETTPSLRSGYSQLADTFFKGVDGSLLLYGITKPFNGRLVLLGGSVFSGKITTDISFNQSTYILTITYVDGTTEDIQLPAPSAAGRYAFTITDSEWQNSPSGSELPYSTVIQAATHGRGANPEWQFYGNQFFDCELNALGDITIYTRTKKTVKGVIL